MRACSTSARPRTSRIACRATSETGLAPKTAALVARIAQVETTITANETEALLLEQTLIKEWRPPYNILLRDDKSYPYVFLSDGQFPR
jgi:excinuclease ABC subunit C